MVVEGLECENTSHLREENDRIVRLNLLISFTEDFFVHWPPDIISFHTHI